MLEFIIKYWIEFLFGCGIALISWTYNKLINEHKNRENQEVIVRQALIAILKDRLYQGCKHFLQEGSIDINELDNINALYDAYHNLGGNHGMQHLVDRVRKLPVDNGKE